jgi:hypothetical protein
MSADFNEYVRRNDDLEGGIVAAEFNSVAGHFRYSAVLDGMTRIVDIEGR